MGDTSGRVKAVTADLPLWSEPGQGAVAGPKVQLKRELAQLPYAAQLERVRPKPSGGGVGRADARPESLTAAPTAALAGPPVQQMADSEPTAEHAPAPPAVAVVGMGSQSAVLTVQRETAPSTAHGDKGPFATSG